MVSNISVLFDIISDHTVVTSTLVCPRSRPTKLCVNYRKTKNIDVDFLQQDIMNSVMITTLNDNISSVTIQYIAILRRLYKAYASEQTRWATLRLNAPWYDDDLREAKRKKRRLERKISMNIILESAKNKLN